jgi:threonine-phosphate decarboxylase
MLSKIHKLKVYSSAVNFFLIRLVDTYITGKELYQRLCNKNILIRECSDFRGLDDTYIRIAILTHEQNIKLVQGIKEAIST